MKKLSKYLKVGRNRRLKYLKGQDYKKYKESDGEEYAFRKKEQKPQTLREFLLNWILKKDGWAWLIIVLIVVGGGLTFLFATPFFKINEINLNGNNHISSEELNNIINKYKNSKSLLIFPRNNYIFFNEKKLQNIITENIQNKFALESISITKKLPNKININISERIPGLIWQSGSQKYLLDITGFPTEEFSKQENQKEEEYPKITDQNEKPVEIGQQVISEDLISFVLDLDQTFPQKTNLEIKEYFIPEIQCQEKVYRAEKILAEEIDETEDVETKNKKKEILEQYNAGELDVEESLDLLDEIKREEKKNKESKSPDEDSSDEFIEWRTYYEPVECDLVKINTEINILTANNFAIYLDSSHDLDKQLENLNSILLEIVDNKENLNYIDLRFQDKVYYK
ncbi:MAG: FtsQ-type POTRA domain-containing protein [Patescibacteria group bacterium]